MFMILWYRIKMSQLWMCRYLYVCLCLKVLLLVEMFFVYKWIWLFSHVSVFFFFELWLNIKKERKDELLNATFKEEMIFLKTVIKMCESNFSCKKFYVYLFFNSLYIVFTQNVIIFYWSTFLCHLFISFNFYFTLISSFWKHKYKLQTTSLQCFQSVA